MDSYGEVRRVRKEMSEAVGHDVRKLAAMYNARRAEVADRIIDPGTKAEQCDATEPGLQGFANGESIAPAR